MTRGDSPLASPRGSRRRRDCAGTRPGGAPGAIHHGVTELWTRYGLREPPLRTADRPRPGSVGRRSAARHRRLERQATPLAWLSVDDFATQGAVVRDEPLARSDRPGFTICAAGGLSAGTSASCHLTIVRGPSRRVRLRPRASDGRRPVRARRGNGGARRPCHVHRSAAQRARPDRKPAAPSTGIPAGSGSLFRDRRSSPASPVSAGRSIAARSPGGRRPDGSAGEQAVRPIASAKVLIALDVQTMPGPHWTLHFDEELVESLMCGRIAALHALAKCVVRAFARLRSAERSSASPSSPLVPAGTSWPPSPTCWGASARSRRRPSSAHGPAAADDLARAQP